MRAQGEAMPRPRCNVEVRPDRDRGQAVKRRPRTTPTQDERHEGGTYAL